MDQVLAACQAQCWELHTYFSSDPHSSPGIALRQRCSQMSWAQTGGGTLALDLIDLGSSSGSASYLLWDSGHVL